MPLLPLSPARPHRLHDKRHAGPRPDECPKDDSDPVALESRPHYAYSTEDQEWCTEDEQRARIAAIHHLSLGVKLVLGRTAGLCHIAPQTPSAADDQIVPAPAATEPLLARHRPALGALRIGDKARSVVPTLHAATRPEAAAVRVPEERGGDGK